MSEKRREESLYHRVGNFSFDFINQRSVEAEEANFKQILTGEMNIVYSSPEAMIPNDQRREIVCSPIYQESVVAVAVYEAQCITHW